MPSDESFQTIALPYSILGSKLEILLRDLLSAASIVPLDVAYRVKSESSALLKLGSSNQATADPRALHDLLGIRVITYFEHQVDEVARILESEFHVAPELRKDRRRAREPDGFGYQSLHYTLSLGPTRAHLPEWAAYSSLRFEVQIRSVLQHAWAEVEHDLGYKSPVSIPSTIRRRFARLAGLLEIADGEFIGIRNDLEKYASDVRRSLQQGEDAELNAPSVQALIDANQVIINADQTIAALYGCALSNPSSHYAGARAEELITAGFESTTPVIRAVESNFDAITHFAAGWLNLPRGIDDEYIPDEMDMEGRWTSLPRGISLFYLWLYTKAATESARELAANWSMSGDPSASAQNLVELGEQIDRRWPRDGGSIGRQGTGEAAIQC